ncbi:hypothetical protein JB92DRAFT_2070480 [Gautieria morchelliformis]|nr:hypothetical protein JB92DRAFT_2070480 [Gautieria morchelliformis]
MMRELVTGTIALADPNVHLLFRQAAWQAEKASDLDHRESHLDLKEVTFGEEVIRCFVADLIVSLIIGRRAGQRQRSVF